MKLQEIIHKVLNNKNHKKYIAIFLFCGILLMLLPTPQAETTDVLVNEERTFSLENEEKRLEKILSSIQGVHKCNVLLSVATGTELVFAENNGETIVISKGNEEEPVAVLERYPGYQGAVIVIGGYSDANVRYDVLSAVMSYTGLDHDKITICPIEE